MQLQKGGPFTRVKMRHLARLQGIDDDKEAAGCHLDPPFMLRYVKSIKTAPVSFVSTLSIRTS